jgi:hypothetical protein
MPVACVQRRIDQAGRRDTAGSNPVAPTYREPLCIKGSFLIPLRNFTLKFARCQDYVKIFGEIL